jgi:hypothetical protein
MSDDAITVIEVSVARVIDEDGRMDVRVKTPAHYNAVELLGLLSFAQLFIANEMRMRDQ